MEELTMKTRGLLFALISAGALTLTAQAASARIVCNSDGDCWHVQGDYEFKPEFGVVIHPDDWKWKEGEHFRWHEHEGRGYWKGSEWKEF
jgi:hypothetical protein